MDEETKDIPYDYFFTSAFSIWGWASWSRVVNQWDEQYSFLNDAYNMQQLQNLIKARGIKNDFIKTCQLHRDSGVPQFESIFWSMGVSSSTPSASIMFITRSEPKRRMMSSVSAI